MSTHSPAPEREDVVERIRALIDLAVERNHCCVFAKSEVPVLKGMLDEIEHLRADVTAFSFQHTLDQEEIESLRSVLKAAHGSTDPKWIIEQACRKAEVPSGRSIDI